MADFRSNRNVLFSCKYRVVFCPKYRKPVLNPPIDAKLKKLIQQVCDEKQSALIEMEVMPDHSLRVFSVGSSGCCARAFQHYGRTVILCLRSAALPSRSSSNTLKIRRGSDGNASNDFNCRS